MRRSSELRFEMGFGGGRRAQGGRHSGRGHREGDYPQRGHGMHRCHSMSDERFGHGGHGGHGGRGAHGHHGARGGRHGSHEGRGRGHGRGDGRFGGARRISSDELQLLVLSLLAEKPLHGYQIIKELETLSQGFYKPSPGMIYPLLSFLEESELANVEMDGTKKCYVMTAHGRSYFSENEAQATTLLEWLKAQGELVMAMENAYEAEQKSADHPLKTRVKEIRTLLHNRPQEDEATQTQLAQILDEAIAKIKAL